MLQCVTGLVSIENDMIKYIKLNRKINCKKGFVPKLLLMVRDLLCKMKRTYPN